MLMLLPSYARPSFNVNGRDSSVLCVLSRGVAGVLAHEHSIKRQSRSDKIPVFLIVVTYLSVIFDSGWL